MPLFLKYALSVLYLVVILFTIVRILLDTHSTSKTLAYILLVIVVPVAGCVFYYAFGVNYRHLKMTQRKMDAMNELTEVFRKNIPDETSGMIIKNGAAFGQYTELMKFIHEIGKEDLCANDFRLLINGEEKFPEVLHMLETASNSIHLEYYDWENDNRGNQIKSVLLKKISEGVKVRVIYDDYASRKIRGNIVKELKDGGVEIFPSIKVMLVLFASRMNHRDHRKLVIVDGKIGFVGGINISDRYDNSIDTGLYWRDTHVKITGPTVRNMQRHFLTHWNALQPNKVAFSEDLFPNQDPESVRPGMAQIMAGGPIFPMSNIMLTYFRIFSLAREKLYITNPYFIPSDSILDAMKTASIGGVDVRLMMPEKSDSAIVGYASQFYYRELLQAGVKIYLYKKGFIHAKTVVADGCVSVVGTANMDIRSFELNLEIMSVIYSKDFGRQLEAEYLNDIRDCTLLTYDEWLKIGRLKQLKIGLARLISEFL